MLSTGCVQAPVPDNGDTTLNESGVGNDGENDGNNAKEDLNEKEDDDITNATNESEGLEGGSWVQYAGAPLPPGPLGAYKSEKREFDIENVTLEFFYGVINCDIDVIGPFIGHYPSFDVGFENDDGDRVIIKHVEEELVSEKYGTELIYDHNLKVRKRVYNYSEFITIPKELFTSKTGKINFILRGDIIRDEELVDSYTSLLVLSMP